jgi:DNA polymerase-4
MGMDECFLDLTGCLRYLGRDGRIAADEIRSRIKNELGITVSVGVSFNKVFAKLGSDLKKPDATTVISTENYRNMLWDQPADSILGVGRATYKKLASIGVTTLGQLAAIPEELLEAKFGKIGLWLWAAANGLEHGEVCMHDYSAPIKSVGHSSNAMHDLTNDAEVWSFMLWLSQELSYRMRRDEMKAWGVMVTVRENNLSVYSYQRKFDQATSNDAVIAREAYELFLEKHKWRNPLRSVGISGIYLENRNTPEQLTVFCDGDQRAKLDRLDDTIDRINNSYGGGTITRAACLCNANIPGNGQRRDLTMPNVRYMG